MQEEFTGYAGRTFDQAQRHRDSIERVDQRRVESGAVSYVVRAVEMSDGRVAWRVFRIDHTQEGR